MSIGIKIRIFLSSTARGLFIANPVLYDNARRYWRVFASEAPLLKRMRLELYDAHDISFLQIGANDGISNDLAREVIVDLNMRGLSVEPLAFLFDKLCKNYAHVKRVVPVQRAVCYDKASITLHHLSRDYLESHPDGASLSGLASSDPDHIRRHFAPDLRETLPINSAVVECTTPEKLMEEYKFDRFDIIFLDAEGMDGEIIMGMDLTQLGTRLLVYENSHLGSTRKLVEEFLDKQGFDTFDFDSETLAVRRRPVGREWR